MIQRYLDRQVAHPLAKHFWCLLACAPMWWVPMPASADASQIEVHYVRLTGVGGENDRMRSALQDHQRACIDLKRSLGQPAPVLGEGVPQDVTPVAVQIYDAANRTMEVIDTLHHRLSPMTCDVQVTKNRTLVFLSAAGRCEVDTANSVARGMCDMAAHERAPRPDQATRRAPDMEWGKVPAEVRRQLQMQSDATKPTVLGVPGGLKKTGEHRVVAGETCEVFQAVAPPLSYCMARPQRDSAGRFPQPAQLPGSGLGGGISGVLLEARNDILPLLAQELRWAQRVNADMFALPPGVVVQMSPSARRPL